MKVKRVDINGNLYDIEAFISPIPVGTVLPFAGNIEPEGFLFTEGQEVLRNAYPGLFAAIGTTYGAGDGATTFNLPDYREIVFVGAGQNAKLDIKAHDVYELGQFKDDQLQGHSHDTGYAQGPGPYAKATFSVQTGNNTVKKTLNATDQPGYGAVRVGTTTHSKQIGIRYIIKY